MEKYIRNINQSEVISLSNQVDYLPGQIVSKTLVQNKALSITLFAFDKNEEISTHESDGDAMITVFDGVGRITIAGNEFVLNTGETIIMPAKKPHSVFALEKFKMMLTVVFPNEH